jgi:heat shock protein HslJ
VKRRSAVSTVSAVLLVALLAVSCADDGGEGGSADGSTLEGVTWVLQRDSIDDLVADTPAEARVDILFDGGQASGASGCNRYFGDYQTDGSAITFGPLGGTQMACEEPLMDLEATYLAALEAVSEFEVSADELVLTGDDVRLVFDAEAPPEPLPLVGTVWSLEAVGSGTDAVSSPIAGTEVTIDLAEDGSASGSGGCNSFNTSYETGDGNTISFGPIASTAMACEQDVSDQEAAVLGALDSAATYEIVGEVLTLNDADGGFLVSYRGA